MVISSLIIILAVLIFLGIFENYYHNKSLKKIPIRIHVNGARGKSSVTRLIASGLRAGGITTMAKTTGSAPRIIDESGKDHIIHRLRSASIGEQLKLLKMFSFNSSKSSNMGYHSFCLFIILIITEIYL